MALPRVLKLMNVFNNGHEYRGIAQEIELPKLAMKIEDYRAGGMIGEVGINLGLDKLEMTHKYAGIVPDLFTGFASDQIDSELIRFAGAYQRDDTGEVSAVEIVMRQRELMMIHGDFLSFNTATSKTDVDYAVARAVGLRAKIDKEIGWHKNISNVAIDGVTGVTKPMSFDIQDDSTDVNLLNSKNISVPLNFKGFRIWGGRTLSSDTLFAFEQYTRTAQIIADTFGEAYDWAIDKDLTPTLVKDMVEMINKKFRYWKYLGYIVDGNAWIDPEINTKDIIKDGKFYIDYDYTPMPSLENLNLRQRITDKYLMDFAAKVAAA